MTENAFPSSQGAAAAQEIRAAVNLWRDADGANPAICGALMPERFHVYDTGHSLIDTAFHETVIRGIRAEVLPGQPGQGPLHMSKVIQIVAADSDARQAMREDAIASNDVATRQLIDSYAQPHAGLAGVRASFRLLAEQGLLGMNFLALPYYANTVNYGGGGPGDTFLPAFPLHSVLRHAVGSESPNKPLPMRQVLAYYTENEMRNFEPENLIERAEHYRLLAQFAMIAVTVGRVGVIQRCGGRRLHDETVAFMAEHTPVLLGDDVEGKHTMAVDLAGLLTKNMAYAPQSVKRELSLARRTFLAASEQIIGNYTAFRVVFARMGVPMPDQLAALNEKYNFGPRAVSAPSPTAAPAASKKPAETAPSEETAQPDPALVEALSAEAAGLSERAQKLVSSWTHSGTRHDKLGLRPVSDDIRFGVADYRGQACMSFVPGDLARQVVNLIQLIGSRVAKHGGETVLQELQSALREQQAINAASAALHDTAVNHHIPVPRIINTPDLTQASRYVLDDALWRHVQTAIRNHWPLKEGKYIGQRVIEAIERLRAARANLQG